MGLKYQYFVVKIGMRLSFTIKNKCKSTNLKFEFKNYFIFTPEKELFLGFKENPSPQKKFSLCFGSDSALNTINTQMLFFFCIFENGPKKNY